MILHPNQFIPPNWRGWKCRGNFLHWEDNIAFGVFRYETKWGTEHRWYKLRRIGDKILYQPVLAQTVLTTGAGTQQTLTSDATWNNTANTVEMLAGGGSGSGSIGTAINQCSGGAAGAYSKITNFVFATPGSTTAGYQLGSGGAQITANTSTPAVVGNNGGDTWFNGTSFATGTDNTKCNAQHGAGGVQENGGAGQIAAAGGTTGWGQTINAGGDAGLVGGTVAKNQGSGGGGAGGPNGAGNAGAAIGTGLTNAGSNGGQGDSTFGGAGGTAGAAGSAGTEWGSTGVGSGGGGAGSGAGNASTVGGAAGNYGAGGAGSSSGKSSGGPTAVGGAGTQGLGVLTWTPTGAPPAHGFIMTMMGVG